MNTVGVIVINNINKIKGTVSLEDYYTPEHQALVDSIQKELAKNV